MANAEAAARYAELPVPTTRDEAWRFTDLTGFDPEAFPQSTSTDTGGRSEQAMLDLDVAGVAQVTEAGIEIVGAPEGVRFELLDESNPRLYELVGWTEKFAAHNAAVWTHGLLVHVPKGVELEKPLYVRIMNTVD